MLVLDRDCSVVHDGAIATDASGDTGTVTIDGEVALRDGAIERLLASAFDRLGVRVLELRVLPGPCGPAA